MKLHHALPGIFLSLFLVACSDSTQQQMSSDNYQALQQEIINSAPPNSVSGTVPGTIIEAFGDNGSYIKVHSRQNSPDGEDNGFHPFTIELQPGIGYRLVMTTNEGTGNEIVTPISFRLGHSGNTGTRFQIEDGSRIFIGHVALELDPEKIIDTNSDGIVDAYVLSDDVNPLSQTDVDGDGVNDFDDDDLGQYQYKNNERDPLDPDHDGIVSRYDRDDDNDGVEDAEDEDDDNDGAPDTEELDSDEDGVPDLVDVNPSNDEVDDNRYEPENDLDGDGVHNAVDEDDDNDGALDINEDEEGDGVANNEGNDDDGDGLEDGLEDDNNDGIVNEQDNDDDGDGDGADDVDENEDMDGTDPGQGEETGETEQEDGNGNDPETDQGSEGNILSGEFQILAVNDLGMHCADLDYSVFSILPPFNVVHAQVIQKGKTPLILDDESIQVTYEGVSNPVDPVVMDGEIPSINTTSDNIGFYKTNFWEGSDTLIPQGFASAGAKISLGGVAYAPLYPGVQVADDLAVGEMDGLCQDPAQELGCPSILTAFEPLMVDNGLPVPELERLHPGDGASPALVAHQQKMPGGLNTPQPFNNYFEDLAFFTQFDFGARLENRKRFAAEGIPILPVDDQGRSNAYPMMKVSASDKATQQLLAALDVVLPVASEADCQLCHAEPIDCLDPALPASSQSDQCKGWAVTQTEFEVMTLDDQPPGQTRLEQLLNTSKINILRLHDAKHGDTYRQWSDSGTLQSTPCDSTQGDDPDCLANQTPVQCSQCHYSPALDLAQVGPQDEPAQGAEGRQQTYHQTMSSVMHRFHAKQQIEVDSVPALMFPVMPAADDERRVSGLPVNDFEVDVLNNTCYSCHPGKNTQCLRGAMATAGVVCQDCHGNLEQVGNDFSIRVSSTNPGDFVMDGSLRVPWASEPGCQSCHTGDALNPNHPQNAVVAEDGIRLLQAYLEDSVMVDGIAEEVPVANIIRSRASRFAENQAMNESGEEIDVLYRLSMDNHGGVMCEGCHGSTHAIWPNQNPYANDNVAAQQLQGHAGALSECSSCHTESDLGNTLGGPHGMHPVGEGRFTDGGHEELFEDNKSECQSCHGVNGEGTVLSRVFVDRSFSIESCEKGELCPGNEEENFLVTLSKGTRVSCQLCHENYMIKNDD